ncbi:hypothetical protein O3G_MSEX000286 [Manduca sexta]|nr:hypothetical protein O3G_MSEX000286 [Manduca sexta]
MEEELKAFEENDAWTAVSQVSPGKTLVQCKWVYKRKLDSDNSVRYHARLVAKGFTQKPGQDYIAFLNGVLKEEIYMVHPDVGSDNKNNGKIVKLNKAVYGLKQSSRLWYEKVDKCLTELGFNRSYIEPCVFTKFYDDDKIIIALCVDDFFVYSNSKLETDNLTSILSSKFNIKDLGQVKQCLGMRVKFDNNNNACTLDQEQYIDQLLIKYNMVNCKEANTSMESKLNIDKNDYVYDGNVPYQQ